MDDLDERNFLGLNFQTNFGQIAPITYSDSPLNLYFIFKLKHMDKNLNTPWLPQLVTTPSISLCTHLGVWKDNLLSKIEQFSERNDTKLLQPYCGQLSLPV